MRSLVLKDERRDVGTTVRDDLARNEKGSTKALPRSGHGYHGYRHLEDEDDIAYARCTTRSSRSFARRRGLVGLIDLARNGLPGTGGGFDGSHAPPPLIGRLPIV